MGACFRLADIDSAWQFSRHACEAMVLDETSDALQGELVTITSDHKNDFIKSTYLEAASVQVQVMFATCRRRRDRIITLA